MDFLSSQTEEAIKADDVELAGKLADVLAKEFSTRPEAIFLWSRLARLDGRSEDAIQLAVRAFEIDPLYTPPFDFLCAHYRRTKHPEKVELLCERVLELTSRLSPSHKSDVLLSLAQLRMSLGKYDQAADHYGELLKLNVPDNDEDGPAPMRMAFIFNAAESGRRAGRSIPLKTWKTVIELFERFPALGGAPIGTANHCQAMHIPYALVGDLEKAMDCLRKARRVAETVNDLEQVFTVRDYRDVDRDEFKAINQELLAALERGELWDGTKLPVSAKDEPGV